MKITPLSLSLSPLKISLLALLFLPWPGIAHAQQAGGDLPTSAAKSAQFKAAIDKSKEKLAKARKQKKEAFPKLRHDLKNKKVRAELVRKIKEAEKAHIEAVHEQAVLRGLKTEGSLPNGGNFRLIDFDEKDRPIYEDTMNADAAVTTAADQVRDDPTYQNTVQIQVEAEDAYPSNQSGLQVEACSDTGGGQNLAFIENGDWAEYTINVPATGQYRINIRTASNNNDGGVIDLSIDGSSVTSVEVPDTNGWQNWTTILAYVYFDTTGNHTLRMNFSGGAGYLFNVNWFSYNRTVIIGQWESNTALITHRELEGKVSLWDDSTPGSDQNHATHVAGTLIARGISSDTQGMAPEASLASFDTSSSTSEITNNAAAAPNTTDIHLSNHSYGVTRGWRYDGGWEWKGEYEENGNQEDFYDENFGRYNGRSELWDQIAYDAPYYLMFISAGNGRSNGPSTGNSWTYQDGFSSVTVPSYDPTIHPLSNRAYKGNNDGYDTMEGGALGKNTIGVGSSDEGIDGNGDRDPSFATAQSYSCRGPADDGRIKPDIHANGTGLKSSIASSNSATASYGGTSMSSPNACGSAALLIDYFSTRFPNQAMRASTLKALILHTADDRGTTGPDYKYGWGVMNTKFAADVIKLHADGNGGAHMLESVINDTTTTSESHSFDWDGNTPLRVTLCWTDPASDTIDGHDNRTKALVNDLNLKITGPGGTHYPYVMPYVGDWSLSKIDDPATTGINTVDPIEQVYLASPAAGTYTITVDYVGGLTNDEQVYSLIVTGNSADTGEPEIEVEADGPPVVSLSSNGTAQDFGSAAPSDPSVTQNYTIRNTGDGPLTGLSITKGGSHPNDFNVGSLSTNELLAGATTTFTVSYDPVGAGARTAQLDISSNDSDENPFIINLSAIGYTEIERWRLEYFGSISDGRERGDDVDFDRDGYTNLMEFAMATDPTVPNAAPMSFEEHASTVDLTYDRNVAAMADYDFQVEWNDNLGNPSGWFDTGVVEQIMDNDGSVQEVKATAPKGNGTQRFFHLNITPK